MPKKAVVGCLILWAVAASTAWAHGTKDDPAFLPRDSAFELVDGSGAAVRARDFEGRWLLVYFGFTRCPDACPTGLKSLTLAVEALGPGAAVQPVFISVDPRHDTPARVDAFVAGFGPRLVGLTGDTQQVFRAARNYGVRYAYGASATPEVSHTDNVYVIAPDGHPVAVIPGALTPQAMAARLRAVTAQADPDASRKP